MPRRVEDIRPADHRRSVRSEPQKEKGITRPKIRTVEKPTRTESIPSKNILDLEEEIHEDIVKNYVKPDRSKEPRPIIRENRLPEVRPELREATMPITPPPPVKLPAKKKIWKWPLVVLGLAIFITGAGYVASVYYSRATFTITPKKVPVGVSGTFVAQGAPSDTSLSYQVLTARKTASTTVTAVSGPATNTKAAGKATFYNSWSSQTVRLIAGTRVSSDSGSIYRLTSSIVIPGYTKPKGAIVPGSITANIVADQAGQDYNMTKSDYDSDLKIVAYKGSEKYDLINARLATNITGGFTGIKKTVNSTVLASTTAVLKSKLASELKSEIEASLPPGFVIFENAYTSSFPAATIGGGSTTTAIVSQEGVMHGLAFPRNRLIETLAGKQTISSFKDFEYTATGVENLAISITNLKDFSPSRKNTLILNAKGSLTLVGVIPIEEIKKKLSGITLAETQDVFKSYSPIIESGSGELVPPWAKIPTDLDRITVNIQED